MKVIVLAAGQGSRLRPLTNHQPKCMVPYQGTPLINSILNVLKDCHLTQIAVVHGYCHRTVKYWTGAFYSLHFKLLHVIRYMYKLLDRRFCIPLQLKIFEE